MNCSCRKALKKGLVNHGIYEQGFKAGRMSLVCEEHVQEQDEVTPAEQWEEWRSRRDEVNRRAGRLSSRNELQSGLVWDNGKTYEEHVQEQDHTKELLREVLKSDVVHNDKRLNFLTVQVDRWLWQAIRKELEQ